MDTRVEQVGRRFVRVAGWVRRGLRVAVVCTGLFVAVSAHAQSTLQTDLSEILDVRAMRDAEFGVQVVDVRTGQVVFAEGEVKPLIPASTMKVVTAATALTSLGPSFAFTTQMFHTGEIEGDTLKGDLILSGHGDPTLVVERVWRLLRDLRQDGVRRIEGNVLVDDTYFTGDHLIPGWNKQQDLDEGPSYFPPIGALQLDYGAAVLVVRPGAKLGDPASVTFQTPAEGYLSVDNKLVTVGSRARRRVRIQRVMSEGKLTFQLEGSIPIDEPPRRYRRAISDPTAFAVGVIDSVIDEVGIAVQGDVQAGALPDGAHRLRTLYSPPLASVLMDTNKYSSNYMAESVLRAVGAETGETGNTEEGLKAVRAYLAEVTTLHPGERLVNGSGLSRDARLTADTLTHVLVDMANRPSAGPEFVGSLSIAGRDGTLIRRLRDVPGMVRGKTGTIDGVHGLAGYVETSDGGLYAFAFLVNEIRGGVHTVKAVHDAFLRRIISEPKSP